MILFPLPGWCLSCQYVKHLRSWSGHPLRSIRRSCWRLLDLRHRQLRQRHRKNDRFSTRDFLADLLEIYKSCFYIGKLNTCIIRNNLEIWWFSTFPDNFRFFLGQPRTNAWYWIRVSWMESTSRIRFNSFFNYVYTDLYHL